MRQTSKEHLTGLRPSLQTATLCRLPIADIFQPQPSIRRRLRLQQIKRRSICCTTNQKSSRCRKQLKASRAERPTGDPLTQVSFRRPQSARTKRTNSPMGHQPEHMSWCPIFPLLVRILPTDSRSILGAGGRRKPICAHLTPAKILFLFHQIRVLLIF
jgi:hypothetical protein